MNSIGLSILFVIIGTVLLRLAGRRSISQMTFGSVMVMLSLGAIFAEPVARKDPGQTLLVVLTILATLVILELLELKFDVLQRLLAGKAVMVIENGCVNEQTLKKLRLTRDKLEMRLRQKGIKHLSDVKSATIEANGELGYELQPDLEPLSVGEFQRVMKALAPSLFQALQTEKPSEATSHNLFDDIEPSNAINEPHPKHLQ